jgi:hypothetical protein
MFANCSAHSSFHAAAATGEAVCDSLDLFGKSGKEKVEVVESGDEIEAQAKASSAMAIFFSKYPEKLQFA